MHMSSSLRGFQLSKVKSKFGSHLLTNVLQPTLLGVVISSDLSWSNHSRLIRAKMLSHLGDIRRFGRCLNAKARLLAYNTFVRPHLNYYLPLWGNTNVETTRELGRVLTRCLRTISGSQASTFSRDTFDSYNICDFATQVCINNALTLFVQFHLPRERQFLIQ